MSIFVENCKYYEVFFQCCFQSYCGLLLKNLNFGQKFMSGHSIAEHLKFIEKRDNKSVKKTRGEK